jgi:polyisoprenyl-teichoic acid--peptidoglycan teichoic acid transferase
VSITTAPPTVPPAPPPLGGSPAGPPEPPPKLPRKRIAWRVALGCVIVLACATATSAVFWSGELNTLKKYLSINPSLKLGTGTLAPTGFGGAQTMLLVGNDQRKHTTTAPVLPHSNEMLLVRLDPGKPYISMMSLPRELQVTINCPQGRATTRLNYALTCGGIATLVKTIKHVTGVQINHVVEIDFNQFQRAITEIGCVYSTVDRRYYHVNVPGGEQYQEINLLPGYQRMCGNTALQFVSYRHGDTSLVRDARDQSFLLDAKKEYGPTLVDNVHKFERIFGESVETDPSLHTTTGILDLLGTLISSSTRRVRQVKFQVNLQPTGANPCSCDTATRRQIQASVHAFLFGGTGLPPKKSVAAVANAVHRRGGAAHLPLVPTGSAELSDAIDVARQVPFPLEFPRVQDRGGSFTPAAVREYNLHAPGGYPYPAYVAVFQAGGLGQFYDVQGTTWTTPPLLDNPDQTVQVGPRKYYLYYEGQHLETVAWYEHGAAYWVRNTLTQALGNGELLAIAEQTVPATRRIGHAGVKLRSAAVPQRTVTQPANQLKDTLGSIGGLLALLALPLLAIPLVRRRRELAKLRAQLAATMHFEEQLTAVAPVPVVPVFAPVKAGPRPGEWSVPVYTRRSPVRTRVLVGGIALLLVAIGAVGIYLNVSGGHAVRHVRRPGLAVPSVSVAVLNATSTQGAAGRLARQLRASHVKVGTVGNLTEPLPPGLEILYSPGYSGQAALLARSMSARHPKVEPINPVAQAAAGRGAHLAVVIG